MSERTPGQVLSELVEAWERGEPPAELKQEFVDTSRDYFRSKGVQTEVEIHNRATFGSECSQRDNS